MLPKALLACVLVAPLAAQGPPANGPRRIDADWFALVNAKVITAPDQPATETTLVLRRGRFAAIGGTPPAGATVIDCRGLTFYPGLVEPYLTIDVPALDAATGDVHWNPMLQPQRHALEGSGIPADELETLRGLGFTAAAIAPAGGILKGTSAVVLLDAADPTEPARVLRSPAYTTASLQTRRSGYPDSEMGAIALLRQTLHDARWLERCSAAIAAGAKAEAALPQPYKPLDALVAQRQLPLWCDSTDELQALRLLRIAAEFERTAVVIGSGMEFRRLAALVEAKPGFVLPLAFPDAPDTSTAAAAEQVTLRHLQTWEQAPSNSKRLLDAGATVAWTTARLRDRKDFRSRAREAIACGLTTAQALAAVTTTPARLLGIEQQVGTIEVGKWANLVGVAGELWDPDAKIHEVWVGGRRHLLQTPGATDFDGHWSVAQAVEPGDTPSNTALQLSIDGSKCSAKRGDEAWTAEAQTREGAQLELRLRQQGKADADPIWLRLRRDGDALVGTALDASGRSWPVRANTAPAPEAKERKPAAATPTTPPPALVALPTPLGGYGRLQLPPATSFAIVGADLWTCDGRGILRDGALLVRQGKIVYAGPRQGLPEVGADVLRIDGTGKHLTPGLIDCHSHTGISRGVNESGQAVTAEVRIEDVLNPDDVNWYRQLAGGVTAVNQLHGSANAIGGQSQTVKLRWGVANPDAMRLAGAKPGIKFALGENPRRANSSGENSRYPNTRMGVDALLRDRFAAAETYRREHAAYNALSPVERARRLPVRRDLELEAIAEVLAGERWIHCHSYRQDEIFMLCRLAQEYGIRIGTFQHVLEGYKVADAIAANAVGASSFSDWWGYKFEVVDAVPDNGAILHEAGVVVSFNSDSNEHARRLNTEAGKAVKYGRMAPADALCFVTRNPAIQLGIFDRTGSLTVGKDADLALWSDNPLSYASRCLATWVDGSQQFSVEEDLQLRAGIQTERMRLLRLAAAATRRAARPGPDPKDAYWSAQDLTAEYCCRDCEGVR